MISDAPTRYGSQLSRHGKLRACASYHVKRSFRNCCGDNCKTCPTPTPTPQTDFESSPYRTCAHAQSPPRGFHATHNAPHKPTDEHRTKKADTPPSRAMPSEKHARSDKAPESRS